MCRPGCWRSSGGTFLSVGGGAVDARNFSAHGAQVGAELAAVVNRMLDRHGDEVNGGGLHDTEEVDDAGELFTGHGADAFEGGRNFFFVAGNGVGGGHDAAGVGIVGRRSEFTGGDAVQEEFNLECEGPEKAE